MNKLKTMLMAGAALFGVVQAWGATWSQMTLTYDSATGTCPNGESASNLLDNNYSTKWCGTKFGSETYAIVFTASTGVPSRLDLVAAKETDNNPGRIWTGWTLYGYDGSSWTAIKTWSGESPDKKAGATSTYIFTNSKVYSSYKVVLNAIASGSIHQMGDLKLYTDTSRTPATVSVSSWATLKANLEVGNSVKLAQNITSDTSGSPWITKTTGSVVLDLNGRTITQAADGSSAKYLVYDSAGTVKLTLKDSAGGGAIVGNSTKATTAGSGGGGFYLGKSGSSLTLDSGTLKNFRLNGSSSTLNGGCIYVSSGCSFTMNGGTISGCTTTGNGGAIYNAGGTVTMDGGTITGCTAATHGGGVYNAGAMTMNGGTIAGNKTTSGMGAGVAVSGSSAQFTMDNGSISGNTANGTAAQTGCGGGIVILSGAMVTINGGRVVNNATTRYDGAIYNNDSKLRIYGGEITGNTCGSYDKSGAGGAIGTGGTTYGADATAIYGGVFADNEAPGGYPCLFADAANTTVYGGVFDVNPATMKAGYIVLGTGYASTAYGSNYIVGKNVAQASGQLVSGTYTFCPTNAEYVAAGVAVKDGKYVLANTTVTPNTWTVSDYKIAVDDDSEYEPTQIVNGGFEIEPWMNYVYNNKTYTFADRDAAWSIPIFSPVSSSITNGVDGGWNTTENQLGIGSLFEWIKGATDSRYPYITQYKVASLPSGSMGAVELNSLNPSSLYQDLTTHGGDVIRWTLAHAPTCQAGATVQTMQVEVGGPTGDASGTGSYIDTNIGSDSKATYTVNGVRRH